MKAIIKIEKEVDIKYIRVEVAVRNEALPVGFPFYKNDMWKAVIEIETGKILNWPVGIPAEIKLKVGDSGCYYLLDENENVIISREEQYVPNSLLPPINGYGDYLELDINGDGNITNWYKHPSIDELIED